MKYQFKEKNQSPWLIDIYNEYIPYKTNGFLVEIGVGHTLKGVDKYLPQDLTNIERCSSNTADLLDLGWSGIYIEPVKEYCIEAEIAHKDNLDRLSIANIGASYKEDELELFLGDSFIPNNYTNPGYDWINRKIQTQITSIILENNKCPKNIDLMSIDVEGFEANVIQGIDFTKHLPYMLVIEIDKIPVSVINNLLPKFYSYVKSDYMNGVWILKNK